MGSETAVVDRSTFNDGRYRWTGIICIRFEILHTKKQNKVSMQIKLNRVKTGFAYKQNKQLFSGPPLIEGLEKKLGLSIGGKQFRDSNLGKQFEDCISETAI